MQKIKKLLLFGMSTVLLVVLMWMCRPMFYGTMEVVYEDASASTDKVSAADSVVQQFLTLDASVQSIDILMQNRGKKEAVVRAVLYRNDGLEMADVLAQATATVPVTAKGESTLVTFSFDMAQPSESTSGCLYLTLESGTKVSYIATEGQYDVPFFVDGTLVSDRLWMAVHYGTKFYPEFWILTAAVAFALLGICFWNYRRMKLEHAFLVLAVTAGVAFAVINPMLQECDGLEHFVRAMDVSYGNVIGSFVNLTHGENEIITPVNFSEISYRLIAPNTSSGTLYTEHLRNTYFSGDTTVTWYQYTVTSVYYWPQGFGIWLGRLFGGSMYTCILLSRLCNLFCYIGITYAAIRRMPVYRSLMALIATLPMTLHQAASDSPDALLNAFCFLFIALCFHYAYDSGVKLTVKHAFGLGLLLAVIFMCKYVYVCVGLLVFLIPQERFRSKKHYWLAFAAALVPLALIGGHMLLTMLGTLGQTQAADGEITQFQYLLKHPLHLVKVLLYTVLRYMRYHIQWLSCLGSMNYELDVLIPIMPCILTAVGILDVPKEPGLIRHHHRVLALFAALFVMTGVCVALYIGDGTINPVGADVILGVQGRYFIPVLLLPFAALGSSRVDNNILGFEKKTMVISGCMLLYAIVTLAAVCY